jgi:lysine 2,3-aminomutase
MHEFGIIIRSFGDRINIWGRETGRLGAPRHPGYNVRMDFSDRSWRAELASMIRDVDALPPEFQAISRARAPESSVYRIPLGITPYYLSLAEPDEADPILRQCLPDAAESVSLAYESDDPLGAGSYAVFPRLIRQYASRALLLANGICAGYCRFCFRGSFAGQGFISERDASDAAEFLRGRAEIRELLVSGGDPLIAEDDRISALLKTIRESRPDLTLRLCTRAPVTLPSRFTDSLLALLRANRPLWILTHFNHPRELSPVARAALRRIADAGIPVLNQAVLLRGVNDSASVLSALFEGLVSSGAKPYYLLQGDLAPGTSHFRVDLARAMEIYGELSRAVSGMALPAFALDLPAGLGKTRLLPGSPLERRNGAYILTSLDGKECPFPIEGI